MMKIVISMEFDVPELVKEIVEWRESCEWTDSHGRSGGHPQSLSVTTSDVVEQIVEWLTENTEAWDEHTAVVAGRGKFRFADENGNSLNLDDVITDTVGNFLA